MSLFKCCCGGVDNFSPCQLVVESMLSRNSVRPEKTIGLVLYIGVWWPSVDGEADPSVNGACVPSLGSGDGERYSGVGERKPDFVGEGGSGSGYFSGDRG